VPLEQSFDIAVVGSGLIGLATAYALLDRTPELRVVLIDKEPGPARHQSGHNSGVVHAGIYYAPGSLKAQLCRDGRTALREFCEEWDVPFVTRGKLVVASHEGELERFEELERRGRANGAELHVLERSDFRAIEPHAEGLRALFAPETAVVDFKLVAAKLLESLVARGTVFRSDTELTSIVTSDAGVTLNTTRETIRAGGFVACAGLQADRVAALAGASTSIRIVPFRGGYWQLRGQAQELVRGLIYPVPDPTFPFLGVHFTRGADERVTAGPNAVPALAREQYRRMSLSPRDAVDAVAWPGFLRLARRYARTGILEIWRDVIPVAAIAEMRRYLPALRGSSVSRAGCGIRAQAMTRDGRLVDDFVIEDGPGGLHVLNAPSPAATSCLAIGRMVAERAALRFGL
jgi:L-2-hydroxyglutarate oxidase LhgO